MSLAKEIANRLKQYRLDADWSLDDLVQRSGISRASLSRLENAEVSPTADTLGKLCAAFGIPISRLLHAAETATDPPVARAGSHPEWTDPETGQHRVSVSPPSQAFAGEVLEIRLPAGQRIGYPGPPTQGLEHHLVLREGHLTVSLEDDDHILAPGDRIRFRLFSRSHYQAGSRADAVYTLFMVGDRR